MYLIYSYKNKSVQYKYLIMRKILYVCIYTKNFGGFMMLIMTVEARHHSLVKRVRRKWFFIMMVLRLVNNFCYRCIVQTNGRIKTKAIGSLI